MNLNTEHRRMEDKSVTAFLLSPHYRTCRHLLLQIIVLLMTINVFWYEPLQSVSFWRRFGGFLAYFVSINTVIYMNLYILVPCFLLKNRLGHYVLAAVLTNLVVIVFLSVTQGLLFEVILPGKDPGRFATFINTFSGILTIGFVTSSRFFLPSVLLPQVRQPYPCLPIGCVIICVLTNSSPLLCNPN